MKGRIVCIGHPSETVWIIDLEVIPTGVCGVTVTTEKESYKDGGAFDVADALYRWDTGVCDLTFVLGAEDIFEGEGPCWLDHISYFVSL